MTCPWCNTANRPGADECTNCGHDPSVPREQCVCIACLTAIPDSELDALLASAGIDAEAELARVMSMMERS